MSRRISDAVRIFIELIADTGIALSGNDTDDAEDIEVSSDVLLFRRRSPIESIGSNIGVEGAVLFELESESGVSTSPSL